MDLNTFATSIVEGAVPFLDKGRTREGLDCWGICVLAYAEVYGIELASLDWRYKGTSKPEALEEVVRREQETSWRQVAEPQPGDVVVFRVGGHPSHIGLVLGDGLMLHIGEGFEAAVERYGSLMWGKRVADFWRHVSRA